MADNEHLNDLRGVLNHLEPLINEREGFKDLLDHPQWVQIELMLRGLRLSMIEQMMSAPDKDLPLMRKLFVFVNSFVELLTEKKDFTDLQGLLAQKQDALINIEEIQKGESEYSRTTYSNVDV